MSATKVKCDVHGEQYEFFVCQHIAESLHTGKAVGFHWPASSNAVHPDAWCTACDEARTAASGDWTPTLEAQLNIQILCGACYEQAKGIWSSGSKVKQ